MPGPPPPPSEVWVDDRLVVRHSRIDGRGLHFGADVEAGTVVIRLGGRLVTSAELDSLIAATLDDPGAPYVDTVTVEDDAHLVLSAATPVHFGNHSCDPTLWHVAPYEIATRRDARAGEEATVDYGTSSGADGFSMACRCGSELCRTRISSDDWRRTELQARYRGHWVPALQRRIDAG